MHNDFERKVSVRYQNEDGEEVVIKLSRIECNLIDRKYGVGERSKVVQRIFNENVAGWKTKLGLENGKSSRYIRKEIHIRIVATILEQCCDNDEF